MDSGDLRALPPDLQRGLVDAAFWLYWNLDLILLVLALAALVGLALLVVSLIAQGGMARGTADVALGQPTSLGQVWETGVRLFWRYLLLFLAMIGLVIVVALVVGAVVALGVWVISLASGAAQAVSIAFGVLVGIVLFLVVVSVFIAIGVGVAFAQRAVAVEDVGPVAGLGIGFRLLRERPWRTLLVWLISLALSIGAGLAVALGVLVLLVPLGGIAVLLFITTGPSAGAFAYSAVALTLLVAGAWLLSAIANTFFWHYWTLAYLSFTGRLADQPEVREA